MTGVAAARLPNPLRHESTQAPLYPIPQHPVPLRGEPRYAARCLGWLRGEIHVRSPLDATLLPVMRGWVAGARENAELLPRPKGIPQVHADGVDADRVLLIGSGAVVGYGVFSYDLSLGGWLARSLSAETERGVDVDIATRTGMTAASALDRLSSIPLWRYEAVVVAVGLNEALDLVSLARWRRDLARVLDYLGKHTTRGTEIVILGVPPMVTLPTPLGPMGHLAQRHAAKLDQVSEELCSHCTHAHFVSLNAPSVPPQHDVPGGEDYRAAAEVISGFLAPKLQRSHGHPFRDAVRVRGFISEERRQLAVDSFAIAPGDHLHRTVEVARELFGTHAAVFSVIDGNTSRHLVHLGIPHEEVDRSLTFCNVTIQGRGAMIVPDATADARFADNPFVTGDPYIRFYAGFPIEAPGGEPIGALCVLDPQPRAASQVDEVLLRRLALQLQQQLHGELVVR